MILITGGLGFIGSHTARALLDQGESCLLFQRRTATRIPDILATGEVAVERGDLADLDSFIGLGDRYPITGIVHLAGSAPWPPSAQPPVDAARTAVTTLLNVFEAAIRWGVPRIGLASTIGVYGGVAGSPPYGEGVPLSLSASHAIPDFKKIGELLAGHLAGATGLEIVNFRIAGVWGPLGRPASVFFGAPQLLHAAAHGVAPDLSALYSPAFTDNGADLCYVKDCGRGIALLQLAKRLNHQTYNIASGRVTTYAELTEALATVAPGTRIDLPTGRDPNGPAHDVFLDISRIRDDVDFKPEYDTQRAAGDYVEWLRAGNER